MTLQSIEEYAQAIREHYRKAFEEDRGKILDEFTKTTGLYRKAIIRLLNRSGKSPVKKRSGRPRLEKAHNFLKYKAVPQPDSGIAGEEPANSLFTGCLPEVECSLSFYLEK